MIILKISVYYLVLMALQSWVGQKTVILGVQSKFIWFLELHISVRTNPRIPKTLKYWVGVQRGQSYLMERCLFSLGWPPS